MITYQIESMTKCIPEISGLAYGHWEEIANNKDKIPLAPDWDKYRKMDAAEMLFLATARDNGVMVGYSVFIIIQLLHYKNNTAATNDMIYLHPNYRNGFCGIKFLKFCHEHLAAMKVDRILWHVKPINNWTLILERMGYKIEEYVVGVCLT